MEERSAFDGVLADVNGVENVEVVEDDRPAAWFNGPVAGVSEGQFGCEGLRLVSEKVVVDAEIV